MNKIYLGLLVVMVLVAGVVIADVTISQFTKDVPIDKAQRDYLLTKVPQQVDAQGKLIPKEIKPVINIECSSVDCKYSAVQDRLISSYDNVVDRMYCSKYENNTCTQQAQYTLAEIQDQVSTAVTSRLTAYANESMASDGKVTTEKATGTITITEKR